MKTYPYTEPVAALLTLGETDWNDWDDYSRFGLTPEHIPDLVRLGTDRNLLINKDVIEIEHLWAPLHAWRALMQMKTVETIPNLFTPARG
jgi:hypothetical protein